MGDIEIVRTELLGDEAKMLTVFRYTVPMDALWRELIKSQFRNQHQGSLPQADPLDAPKTTPPSA